MGTFILRIVVGLLFVGHGLQKLAGMFGGGGIEQTEKMMDALDMHPVKLQARAAGLAETAGGAALVLGAATPLASAGLIATMITAIRKVHAKNGIWNSKGGVEFNLVMIAAAALLAAGPGKASLDAAFGRSKWGNGWTAFALVAGAVGSTLAIVAGKRFAPEPAESTADVSASPVAADDADPDDTARSEPPEGRDPSDDRS
ncbi:DoxX family protein [Humibacter ginsenosidimutans]|uniref:DoxX family protein n=1 Tax=Humibacter ginsenosidimutans TaxID=2599293 RepID=A0A5B8M849_9MICO|nr:DoxX family protein [Humibacter ginsenosidimutans]QDZ15845.1 DoxX family protein [Humibacter ginsenosidimutans]